MQKVFILCYGGQKFGPHNLCSLDHIQLWLIHYMVKGITDLLTLG